MKVMYACDESYVPLTAASMASLFENNVTAADITVYLLGEGISIQSETKLRSLAHSFGRDFRLVRTDAFEVQVSAAPPSRWPKSAYMRLFAGEMLPASVEKVIYLDSDTVVLGPLEPLLSHPTANTIFLGVADCVSRFYRRNIGLSPTDPYVNAGVLVVDLARLRQVNVRRTIDQFLLNYGRRMTYADQDLLNGAFRGDVSIIEDPRYNVTTQLCMYSADALKELRHPSRFYPDEVIGTAAADPVVIHYTTCMLTVRPWYAMSEHPRSADFERYLLNSGFEIQPRKTMDFSGATNRLLKLLGHLSLPLSLKLTGFLHSVVRPTLKRAQSLLNR